MQEDTQLHWPRVGLATLEVHQDMVAVQVVPQVGQQEQLRELDPELDMQHPELDMQQLGLDMQQLGLDTHPLAYRCSSSFRMALKIDSRKPPQKTLEFGQHQQVKSG